MHLGRIRDSEFMPHSDGQILAIFGMQLGLSSNVLNVAAVFSLAACALSTFPRKVTTPKVFLFKSPGLQYFQSGYDTLRSRPLPRNKHDTGGQEAR